MSAVQFGTINGVTFSDALEDAPPTYAPMPEGASALECSVCGEDVMLAPMTVCCGHSFCLHCIWRWLTTVNVRGAMNEDCPACRAKILSFTNRNVRTLLYPNADLNTMANAVMAGVKKVHGQFNVHVTGKNLNTKQTYDLLEQATTAVYRKFKDGSLAAGSWPMNLPAGVVVPVGLPEPPAAAAPAAAPAPPPAVAALPAAAHAIAEPRGAPGGAFAARLTQVLSTPIVRAMEGPRNDVVQMTIESLAAIAVAQPFGMTFQIFFPESTEPTYQITFRVFSAERQTVSLKNCYARTEVDTIVKADTLGELFKHLAARVPPRSIMDITLKGDDIPLPYPSVRRGASGTIRRNAGDFRHLGLVADVAQALAL